MSNVWRDTLLLLRALFIVSLVQCRMWRKVVARRKGKGEETFKDRLCGMHGSAFVVEKGVRVSCEVWKTD